MARHIIFGDGAPASAPESLGQHYIDITNKVAYTAVGTAGALDWSAGGGGGGDPSTTVINTLTAAATVNVDIADGYAHRIVLSGDTVELVPVSPIDTDNLYRVWIAIVGGLMSGTYTWANDVVWGSAPLSTVMAGETNIYELETLDGGSNWYGRIIREISA